MSLDLDRLRTPPLYKSYSFFGVNSPKKRKKFKKTQFDLETLSIRRRKGRLKDRTDAGDCGHQAIRAELNQKRRDAGKEEAIEARSQCQAGATGHFFDQYQKQGNQEDLGHG